MAEPNTPLPLTASRLEEIFPTLTSAQIARVAKHGRTAIVAAARSWSSKGIGPFHFLWSFQANWEAVRPTGAVERLITMPLTRRPFLLETSRPGIFAAGDVRGSNVKRVASAVGEGSIAISFVHQVLRE